MNLRIDSVVVRSVFLLVPGLGYHELAIQDGMAAGVAYLNSLVQPDLAERQKIFADLKDYCGMDTEAMVRLREALLAKVSVI